MPKCKVLRCTGEAMALNPYYWACQNCRVVLKRGQMSDRKGIVAKLLDHSFFEFATSPVQPSKVILYNNNRFYTSTLHRYRDGHSAEGREYVLQLCGNNMFDYEKSPCCHVPLRVYMHKVEYCPECSRVYGAKCDCGNSLILREYSRTQNRSSSNKDGNIILECSTCDHIFVPLDERIAPLSCRDCGNIVVRVGDSHLSCLGCKSFYLNGLVEANISSGSISDIYAVKCAWCRAPYSILLPCDDLIDDIICDDIICGQCSLSYAEAEEAVRNLKQYKDVLQHVQCQISYEIEGYSIRIIGAPMKGHYRPLQQDPAKVKHVITSLSQDLKAALDAIKKCNVHPAAKKDVALTLLHEASRLLMYARSIGLEDNWLETISTEYDQWR